MKTTQPSISDKDEYQLHHDYYLELERQGKADPQDMDQVRLAKAREAAGIVKPLEEQLTTKS